jgi:uncharacterized membrane protein YqiK
MMMNPDIMTGGIGFSMMFFGWVIYVLVIALIILGIVALWKYINQK